MDHWDLDWEMLKSSILMGIRKMSRTFTLFILVAISLVIYLSLPSDQSGLQIIEHPQSNQVPATSTEKQHQGATAHHDDFDETSSSPVFSGDDDDGSNLNVHLSHPEGSPDAHAEHFDEEPDFDGHPENHQDEPVLGTHLEDNHPEENLHSDHEEHEPNAQPGRVDDEQDRAHNGHADDIGSGDAEPEHHEQSPDEPAEYMDDAQSSDAHQENPENSPDPGEHHENFDEAIGSDSQHDPEQIPDAPHEETDAHHEEPDAPHGEPNPPHEEPHNHDDDDAHAGQGPDTHIENTDDEATAGFPLEHSNDGEDAYSHPEEPPAGQSPPSDVNQKPIKHRRFSMVIPVTSSSPDLCKTIVTGLALGYPSPIIINWHIDYHAITKWDGGKNLPKIPGFVNYLDAAMHPDVHPSERLEEDDIVLMVDAFDVWFQLPAEVMLRRYHEINEQANARLRRQWKGPDPMPMFQTVVAASGKNCHPQPASGSNLHCDKLPISPLRDDLYGPETDKNLTNPRDNRPRYINGGVYIGPAGDMRRLFRRAMQKMEAGINQGVHLFSEQGVPGEVLGEQEVWRQWRRDNEVTGDDAMALMDRDFEYHFGLDYAQTLSVQTYWTDTPDGLFDGAFVTLNNQTSIDEYSKQLGISPVRLKGVPEDIKRAQHPLAHISEDPPDWGDMPLYADFFTESVPVIVHHNGFKDRRTKWWTRPWFHRPLRHLLTSHMAPIDPAVPLATVEEEDSTTKYWFLEAEHTDRRPRRMNDTARARLRSMNFGELCHFEDKSDVHWWEEVFRDAEGPLE
ncbi:hypothetical protein S40288_03530 [Stachybotrys chartarum IBT 40288]|nr:hypothetical protein S40288_03530 [Stachybotrys chartarum IBT 40288]